jgi:pimeloyl-ACP methyl ester carboxylesterase
MSHTPLLILVHSPLVGPATWQPVAALLRDRYDVLVPDLHGIAAGPGPYERRIVEEVARNAHSDLIVLAGHSRAGSHLSAIADGLDERVIGAAFIDARLPHPGLSAFDDSPPEYRESLAAMAHDGMLPPWDRWFPPEAVAEVVPQPEQREAFLAELHPIAMAYYEEPAADSVIGPATQCTYLQLSESYQDEADRAEALGWPTTRLDADHLAVLTDPGPVADFLSEFVEILANK